MLNWEKCHFIVQCGIVPGLEISRKWIEVDKAKIDVIAKLFILKCVKDIRSFLGYPDSIVSLLRTLTKLLDP